MSNINLNIQPKAGILGVFSRLNYKAWYAIGEFVDNSTASFFQHERTMQFFKKFRLTIEIDYDPFIRKLKIKDNAYGMEIDDFKRAVLLDSVPDNPNGRNEFGMGLKTAASWFGNTWSVSSTQLNSSNHYYTKIDIKKLRAEDINEVEIKQSQVDPMEHGTVIEITDITKPIDAPQTKKKIKDLLSSMYRRDINSGKVEILFNGEPLKPINYDVLKFRDKEWKKDVDFSFDFNEKTYNVNGFIGIMSKGSFPAAGIALFRYNRVIVGGPDLNYKPNLIFSQAQSQISLKLFGELNMEDFPVNQAKDGFVWDDGLEEEFLNALKANIDDYIRIARLSSKQRAEEEEYSEETSKKVHDKVTGAIIDVVIDNGNELEKHTDSEEFSLEEEFIKEMEEDNAKDGKLLDKTGRVYEVMLTDVKKQEYTVYWEISDTKAWVEYNEEEHKIIINVNHPFFKPYSTQHEFKVILDKFVLAYIVAEELAKMEARATGMNGYVLPSTLRNKINIALTKYSDKG